MRTSGAETTTSNGHRPAVWVVWGAAVLVYLFGVTQRTSLGAAGLDAADRFGIDPGTLSLFVFLQISVYAAGQIPAGMMVDRYGPRVMLLVGGLLLGLGQGLLAFATTLPLALGARVLVGAGDAVAFSSAMVLVARWFPARRVPVATQVTTIVGQLGQVLSALPLLLLLHAAGWSTAFTVAAGASVVSAVVAAALVRNGPVGWHPPRPAPARELVRQVGEVWRRPGTRLGFFGHLGTQFSMMTFSLLWGLPYLVSAQGVEPLVAGALMTLLVIASVVVGPLVGVLTARHPMRRSWILLGVIGLTAGTWTVVLALPGPAPTWLLVVLVVVLAVGGPASVVGFDIARTTNPGGNLAVAQGMVNIAGYSASVVVLMVMGAVLTATGGFTAEGFRTAWLVQYPVWAFAVVGILVTRRKARRVAGEAGPDGGTSGPARRRESPSAPRRRDARRAVEPAGRLVGRSERTA
ncbi:MFS transporter [Pseudonocardia pini]|uniref:MFS transporter n=1 Tax=Pseudonocardia pini TaxID=2758030 RepID=UPI0015F0D42B|nr:MFS transporter [Pseudonocardia pini]